VISRDSRTALYRLYAADGTLLYVGVTGKLSARFYSHSREKRWWPQVAGMRLAWYANKAEVD
jgi:predicted GIY-YIG superfamily endonuclease